jgi:hypothetical protein
LRENKKVNSIHSRCGRIVFLLVFSYFTVLSKFTNLHFWNSLQWSFTFWKIRRNNIKNHLISKVYNLTFINGICICKCYIFCLLVHPLVVSYINIVENENEIFPIAKMHQFSLNCRFCSRMKQVKKGEFAKTFRWVFLFLSNPPELLLLLSLEVHRYSIWKCKHCPSTPIQQRLLMLNLGGSAFILQVMWFWGDPVWKFCFGDLNKIDLWLRSKVYDPPSSQLSHYCFLYEGSPDYGI